ncbi:RNA polymerase sigma factor [Spirosoma montaniterrae]|uniref:RNA polymerase subunit sigma-24 n=1 Tax=Spirosoma montaniterrae TaxID=1178516 RepID=A0A1P9X023_9BACT|nr:sigma-70 family RNA polymerase sigma factor [Spirosoma montaniterrae]AQG80979.1 hypothetical protein AWR27_17600 [Spirosoma montaniterrae]
MPKLIRYSATDDELWQWVREDEESAFTRLMQRYTGQLINYGRKWSLDDELVKDSVQDVFIELWHQRHRTQPIESIQAYLLASVRHRIGRLAQRNAKFGKSLDERMTNEFTLVFSAEQQWIADEESRYRIDQLNRYINQLPARQREVIYLKFHQNLTQSQIAEVMGLQYQSVSNLLQRTLASLRNNLSAELFSCLFGLVASGIAPAS